MDWQECKDKKFVKETSEDKNLISSLVNSSKKKSDSNARLELDEITASTKVSLAYESLREILEALAIKKGFKIYNHECFCSFLKEICSEEYLSKNFDRFRKIRNKINYYGAEIPIGDAKILIEEISNLKNKILKDYFRWK